MAFRNGEIKEGDILKQVKGQDGIVHEVTSDNFTFFLEMCSRVRPLELTFKSGDSNSLREARKLSANYDGMVPTSQAPPMFGEIPHANEMFLLEAHAKIINTFSSLEKSPSGQTGKREVRTFCLIEKKDGSVELAWFKPSDKPRKKSNSILLCAGQELPQKGQDEDGNHYIIIPASERKGGLKIWFPTSGDELVNLVRDVNDTIIHLTKKEQEQQMWKQQQLKAQLDAFQAIEAKNAAKKIAEDKAAREDAAAKEAAKKLAMRVQLEKMEQILKREQIFDDSSDSESAQDDSHNERSRSERFWGPLPFDDTYESVEGGHRSGGSSHRHKSGVSSHRHKSGVSSHRHKSGGSSRRHKSGDSSRRHRSGGSSRRHRSSGSTRRPVEGGHRSGGSSRRPVYDERIPVRNSHGHEHKPAVDITGNGMIHFDDGRVNNI